MYVDTETELEGSEHGTTTGRYVDFWGEPGRYHFLFIFYHTDLLTLVISYAYY